MVGASRKRNVGTFQGSFVITLTQRELFQGSSFVAGSSFCAGVHVRQRDMQRKPENKWLM